MQLELSAKRLLPKLCLILSSSNSSQRNQAAPLLIKSQQPIAIQTKIYKSGIQPLNPHRLKNRNIQATLSVTWKYHHLVVKSIKIPWHYHLNEWLWHQQFARLEMKLGKPTQWIHLKRLSEVRSIVTKWLRIWNQYRLQFRETQYLMKT